MVYNWRESSKCKSEFDLTWSALASILFVIKQELGRQHYSWLPPKNPKLVLYVRTTEFQMV